MAGDEQVLGKARSTISAKMTQLHAEYYGRGPTKAKTYITDDLVVVVLEETFTRAVRTLVDRGEQEAIQQIRRRFQQQMEDEFSALVEQATGRKVRAFLSERNLEHDLAVEIFLLADARTDMTGFEEATVRGPKTRPFLPTRLQVDRYVLRLEVLVDSLVAALAAYA